MVAQQTLTLFVWVQILVPLPKSLGLREPRLFYEVWLSLVERYVRDVEAAGSNPVTSTTKLRLDAIRVPGAAFSFPQRPALLLCASFASAKLGRASRTYVRLGSCDPSPRWWSRLFLPAQQPVSNHGPPWPRLDAIRGAGARWAPFSAGLRCHSVRFWTRPNGAQKPKRQVRPRRNFFFSLAACAFILCKFRANETRGDCIQHTASPA